MHPAAPQSPAETFHQALVARLAALPTNPAPTTTSGTSPAPAASPPEHSTTRPPDHLPPLPLLPPADSHILTTYLYTHNANLPAAAAALDIRPTDLNVFLHLPDIAAHLASLEAAQAKHDIRAALSTLAATTPESPPEPRRAATAILRHYSNQLKARRARATDPDNTPPNDPPTNRRSDRDAHRPAPAATTKPAPTRATEIARDLGGHPTHLAHSQTTKPAPHTAASPPPDAQRTTSEPREHATSQPRQPSNHHPSSTADTTARSATTHAPATAAERAHAADPSGIKNEAPDTSPGPAPARAPARSTDTAAPGTPNTNTPAQTTTANSAETPRVTAPAPPSPTNPHLGPPSREGLPRDILRVLDQHRSRPRSPPENSDLPTFGTRTRSYIRQD